MGPQSDFSFRQLVINVTIIFSYCYVFNVTLSCAYKIFISTISTLNCRFFLFFSSENARILSRKYGNIWHSVNHSVDSSFLSTLSVLFRPLYISLWVQYFVITSIYQPKTISFLLIPCISFWNPSMKYLFFKLISLCFVETVGDKTTFKMGDNEKMGRKYVLSFCV